MVPGRDLNNTDFFGFVQFRLTLHFEVLREGEAEGEKGIDRVERYEGRQKEIVLRK